MRTEIGRMEAFDALLETLLKPPARKQRAPAPRKRLGDEAVQHSGARSLRDRERPQPLKAVEGHDEDLNS